MSWWSRVLVGAICELIQCCSVIRVVNYVIVSAPRCPDAGSGPTMSPAGGYSTCAVDAYSPMILNLKYHNVCYLNIFILITLLQNILSINLYQKCLKVSLSLKVPINVEIQKLVYIINEFLKLLGVGNYEYVVNVVAVTLNTLMQYATLQSVISYCYA